MGGRQHFNLDCGGQVSSSYIWAIRDDIQRLNTLEENNLNNEAPAEMEQNEHVRTLQLK